LVQLCVVDYLGYAIRWDRSISLLFWFLFFKSGIDLLIPTLFFSDTISEKGTAGKNHDGLDTNRKLIISGALITASFIPFSRLITSPQTSPTQLWMSFNFVFVITSVLIILKEHPLISGYSEMIGSLVMTFFIPYFMNILHGILHTRFLIFTSLSFFLLTSAVLIMRNIMDSSKNANRFQNSIIQSMDIRSIFIIIFLLLFAGLTSLFLLPFLGFGISLMPDILVAIPLVASITVLLRKIYLENRGNFQDAFLIAQILLISVILILLIKTRIN